ncbi:hypothetical protein C8J57DRAFT_1221142 [Mycena rebaudengoi]|nr:hypothetical protein C8J57DRAFT_1221142 [Mycena rebaudengoi]
MTVRTTTSSCTATYFYEWSKAMIDCASSVHSHNDDDDDDDADAQDDAALHGHLSPGAAQREATVPPRTRRRAMARAPACPLACAPKPQPRPAARAPPALLLLLGLAGLLAISCVVSGMHASESGGVGEWLGGLVRCAVDDGPAGPNTESDFTKRKLYLIVIFVGLVVVLILGVMLSAWRIREPMLLPMLPLRVLRRSSISLSFLDGHERALPPNYLSYSSARDSRCVDRWRDLYAVSMVCVSWWRWCTMGCARAVIYEPHSCLASCVRWRFTSAGYTPYLSALDVCCVDGLRLRVVDGPQRVRHGGGCARVLSRRPGWARVLLRLASTPRGGVANAASSLRVCDKGAWGDLFSGHTALAATSVWRRSVNVGRERPIPCVGARCWCCVGVASEPARTSRVGGFCVDGGCVKVVPLLDRAFGATAYSDATTIRRVRSGATFCLGADAAIAATSMWRRSVGVAARLCIFWTCERGSSSVDYGVGAAS